MKFDLHVHSCYSHDAVNSLGELLKLAKEKCIGFAITDHNNCNAWNDLKKLNKQYKAHKVPIIFGEEIRVYEGKELLGELLAYFLQETVQKGQLIEVLENLKEQDAVISIAHPFDKLRAPLFSGAKRLDFLKKEVHAVEVFNARCYFNSFNRKAEKFALGNKLAFTAGSDAHFPEEFGNALVELQGITEEEWRKSLLFCNNFSGKLSRKRVHLFTALRKHKLIGPK